MLERSNLEPFDVIEGLLAFMSHAWFVMGHGRRAVMVSEAFCRLSGYTAEEFLALESTTVLSTEKDVGGASKALNRALAGEPPQSRRRVIVRQGGEHVWVQATARLLPLRASDSLVLSQFWAEDERLTRSEDPPQAETSWRHIVGRLDMGPAERQELLGALLGSLSHACYAIGQSRSPIVVTQALCELSGYALEEFLSLDAPDRMPLAPPDQRATSRAAVQSVLAGGPPRRGPRDLARADGMYVPTEASATLMSVRGLFLAILAEFWPLSGETTGTSAA
jgi:PAS domain S-box-containing protein